MKNRGISFTNDLIKDTAEKLGISEREVKEVYYGAIHYIEYSLNHGGVSTIEIPVLGKFYTKPPYLKQRIKKLTKENTNDKNTEKIKRINNQLLNMDGLIKANKGNGLRIPFISMSIENKIKKAFNSKGEFFSWDEVENKQNNK